MNWREAIEKVDKSGDNTGYANMERIGNAVNVSGWFDYDSDFDKRLKKHWIHCWLCTDTHVGLAVYCLDGEPVAVSVQTARKCDEEIEFLSIEAIEKVRQFMLTYLSKEDPPLANLDKEIHSGWFEEKAIISFGKSVKS